MPLEDMTGPDKFPDAYNNAWPLGSDSPSQGDDHLRGVKNVQINWALGYEAANLKTQVDAAIAAAIAAIPPTQSVVTGTVHAYTWTDIPTGYLVCDGAAVSRATYADLFALIGVGYGPGDASTTFNLPDYRGWFLRGQDEAAGVDPDAAIRTDRGDGTTGDNVGTKQGHDFLSHAHGGIPALANNNQSGSVSGSRQLGGVTDFVGGLETRPVNANVVYLIKT
jgi:microcystin-dependent protein